MANIVLTHFSSLLAARYSKRLCAARCPPNTMSKCQYNEAYASLWFFCLPDQAYQVVIRICFNTLMMNGWATHGKHEAFPTRPNTLTQRASVLNAVYSLKKKNRLHSNICMVFQKRNFRLKICIQFWTDCHCTIQTNTSNCIFKYSHFFDS